MSENLIEWMIASPWSTLLVVLIQITLVAAIAGLLALRIHRVDAGRTHVVWLTASCLILVILPIHILTGGWPIEVASVKPRPTADSYGSLELVSARERINEGDLSLEASRSDEGYRDKAEYRDDFAVVQPQATVGLEGVADSAVVEADTASSVVFQPDGLSGAGEVVVGNESAPGRFHLGALILCLYAIGALIFAIRFFAGLLRLRFASSAGDPVDQPMRETAAEIARSLDLSRVPQIVRTDQTSMPLVFGLFRSTVLVPADFESWGRDEIQSTLFHELTHVRRKDNVGQLFASINQVLYWFHPAVYFVNRGLARSREWATDREVVQRTSAVGSELTSDRYAESLLNIVARFRRAKTAEYSLGRAAIAMSRQTEIEDRLKLILAAAPQLSRFRVASLRLMVVLLAVLGIATTVRVKRALAEQPPQNVTTQPESQKDQTPVPASRDTETAEMAIEDDENDLIARVLGCEVTTITGDDYGFMVNASGKVLSPDGDPVEGATVVLADSFGRLAMNEPNKYLYGEERYRMRAPDVMSRTVTNDQGEFRFTDVKMVATPRRSESWRGSIVAAAPGVGVATSSVYSKIDDRDSLSNLVLNLKPTRSVSGSVQTPEGEPLSGAVVDVWYFLMPSQNDARDASRFIMEMSQLTPRKVTDESGRFQFVNLPVGVVASIQAAHADWEHGYSAIRTSDEIALGEFTGARLHGDDVVDSPATVVVDPGVQLTGIVVDENGAGVEGISVTAPYYIRSETRDDGRFGLRIPTPTVSRFLEEGRSPYWLDIHPSIDLGFARQRVECTKSQLTGGDPVIVNLKRAGIVFGTLVDSEGAPAKGINVQAYGAAYPYVATSDDEGQFRISLAMGNHRLVFRTDEPGFALPSRLEFSRLTATEVGSLLHRDVQIVDAELMDLGSVVVPRSKNYQLIVSLPDGSPAIGATAVIRDEVARNPNAPEPYRQVPEVVEKSLPQTTNSLGHATLIPQGLLSEKASVDVKFVDGEAAFNGNMKLNTASDGVINLVLESSSIVEGRVLLDGVPVAGASVQVSQSTPAQRTVNGITMTFFTASENQFVTTDSKGTYRAAIPAGKQCNVSLSQIPNVSINSGIGYGARPAADGKLRVQDFELIRGDQEIAGRVVDANGDPIAKATVQIRRDQNITPSFWVDHESESQSLTGNQGRFHLKNVPRGTYQLSVRAPRVEGSPSFNSISTLVPAATGTMEMEITLNLPNTREIPRLVPKRIITNQP